MKKAICVLLIALLALSAVGYAGESGEEEVAFADPVLENILRKLVDNPEGALTAEALAGVWELNYGVDADTTPEEEKIHDLSGLEYCVNLFKLSIPFNAVGDISPLAGLTGIGCLDLGGNPVYDISALSNLRRLNELNIWRTGVSDLSPLAGCTELTWLDAWGNAIEDVSALAGLSELTMLDLRQNRILNASPLAGLSKLTTLRLAENPVEDWSVLSSIYPNLSESDFSPDQIPDATVIVFDDPVLEAKIREAIGKPEGDVTYGDARAFRDDLYANYNWQPGEEKIRSIEVLRYFTGIHKFEAFGQDIRDLEPLRELTNLGILALDGNPIYDLSPIAGLENLGILQICDIEEAPDLSPISGLPNLHMLYLRDNRIEDISALAGLSNLETLDLSNNNISDLSPLLGLTKLKSLRLAGNPVADFEPIRELLPNIAERDFEPLFGDAAPDTPIEIAEPAFEAALRRAMSIYGRPITEKDAYLTRSLGLFNEKTEESMFSDISPLKYFVNLEHLEFNANPITDLSALQGLTKLRSLKVGFCQVGDLTPLSGLVNLDYLNVACCPVEDFSPLAGLANLRMIDAEACLVSDLTPLSGLTNLHDLNLKNCPVADVSPLANLTGLRVLFLMGCPVADYSPLAGIYPNLEGKDFEIGPAKSAETPAVQSAENSMFQDPAFEKRVRKMLNRPEGDIDPSELTGITELGFNNWDYPGGEIPDAEKIQSLNDLKYFTNLEKLDIGGNAVSDLSPISALSKLVYLEAPRNNIADLSPLADMTQLTWAVFWENDITDLSPVANLVNLETFSVFSNNVSDISPLANLTKLTILELHDNPIEDFSPVAAIYPNLREKDFSLDVQPAAKQAADETPETIPYKELKKGDRGDEVKRMQRELIQLGYLDGKADGAFGEQTAQAVLRFKKANGIQPANSDATPETLDPGNPCAIV